MSVEGGLYVISDQAVAIALALTVLPLGAIGMGLLIGRILFGPIGPRA
jgi:hypothetical protein